VVLLTDAMTNAGTGK